MKIDYSKYTEQEIDQAISSIDKESYPDRYEELLKIKQIGIYSSPIIETTLFEKPSKKFQGNIVTQNPIKITYPFSKFSVIIYLSLTFAIIIGTVLFGNSREETLEMLFESSGVDLQLILILILPLSIRFGYKILLFIKAYLAEYKLLKGSFSKDEKKAAAIGFLIQSVYLIILFIVIFGCCTLILYKENF